jgi:hypothetical protein
VIRNRKHIIRKAACYSVVCETVMTKKSGLLTGEDPDKKGKKVAGFEKVDDVVNGCGYDL